MVIEKIKEKLKRREEKPKEEPKEEFLEIDTSALAEEKKISVRIENLKDFSDTDRIQQMLRDGNVIFLRIRDLRESDISELKRAVDRLKKTCAAMNGDIVGVDEDFLIITPSFARVYRGKAI
jgi:SepF-like predicted cell division protein (DUF552 family)